MYVRKCSNLWWIIETKVTILITIFLISNLVSMWYVKSQWFTILISIFHVQAWSHIWGCAPHSTPDNNFIKLGKFLATLQVFRGNTSGKEAACQCWRHKRCRFDPWVGKVPWRRAWQPTPVFLPGESHGQRSLEGYSPQGHKELDMTEVTQPASI